MAETQNLMDGLFEQMNRAREIKKMYDEIPQGKFGSIMIQQSIDRAEKSIRDNDVIAMLTAFKDLQEIE
jgi:hypothetical protein